jgi:drug/metabolite transporter (DMT)-like permease
MDFAVAYPLARGLPVLLLAAADLARGRAPSHAGWAGIGFVCAGTALIPHRSWRTVGFAPFRDRRIVWPLLTALAVATYSFVDQRAAGLVAPGLGSAVQYGTILYLGSWLVVRLAGATPRGRRPGRHRHGLAWLAAALDFGGYALVLWAYQLATKAAYVLAFRQFSLVLGVAGAAYFFRERGARLRLAAAAVIMAGLVLIAAGG